ncbi:hypothetical protein JCM19240_1155 [Vibrio maritimus]|uniref:Uncharacterized protein n=1 Tax=Vibrio maritimus TaxID=990268 RepID=A0A090TT75_9VIBR|nr:hypothetical protein JCM19240_1155 [Vibrio maritimus]
MIRRRTFYIRPLMYWIVVLGLSYLFLIITFQRSYVDFILPLASEYYAGYFTEMTPLLTMVAIALLAIAAPYRLLLLGRVDKGIVSVLYVSTLGCLSAYVIGRTGFGYHMIPSLVFCVTIVVMSFLVGVRQLGNKHRIITLFYLLVVSATFYFLSGHYFFRTMDTRYEQAWHNWQSQTFPGINRSTLVEHSKIVSLTSFVEPYVLPGDGIIFFAQRMYPMV